MAFSLMKKNFEPKFQNSMQFVYYIHYHPLIAYLFLKYYQLECILIYFLIMEKNNKI